MVKKVWVFYTQRKLYIIKFIKKLLLVFLIFLNTIFNIRLNGVPEANELWHAFKSSLNSDPFLRIVEEK